MPEGISDGMRAGSRRVVKVGAWPACAVVGNCTRGAVDEASVNDAVVQLSIKLLLVNVRIRKDPNSRTMKRGTMWESVPVDGDPLSVPRLDVALASLSAPMCSAHCH